jgi:hypothetical protein
VLLNSSMPEILQKLPDLREITEYWIVYPTKTHVPLNPEDLLYESNRNGSSALILGKQKRKFQKSLAMINGRRNVLHTLQIKFMETYCESETAALFSRPFLTSLT